MLCLAELTSCYSAEYLANRVRNRRPTRIPLPSPKSFSNLSPSPFASSLPSLRHLHWTTSSSLIPSHREPSRLPMRRELAHPPWAPRAEEPLW